MAYQCHFLTAPPSCSWAREMEMEQPEQGASVILGPGPTRSPAGWLPFLPLSRLQTIAHQPDTQPSPSPLALRFMPDEDYKMPGLFPLQPEGRAGWTVLVCKVSSLIKGCRA